MACMPPLLVQEVLPANQPTINLYASPSFPVHLWSCAWTVLADKLLHCCCCTLGCSSPASELSSTQDRQLCSAQPIREMEPMRKQWVAMALGLLVVLALAAEEVNAQCSLSAMAPCYSAVTGAYPPQPAGGPNGPCCAAVRTANPACMCSQFQQGSYPPNMIRNAFAMPRACRRYDIRGYRCGGYTIE